ncbi:phage tail tape measure protein [Acetobacter senegalensis]|uniref:phage tail tape measure protein n=1 Tax=Acetobacter senegalensis TaxID=446692 RepID=UPI00264CD9DF|nr:phage tail tape measure protein [Acetobacter senegalensis]MDN7351759.1 phage tail tape measure protein [Acetobacter senegalensis]
MADELRAKFELDFAVGSSEPLTAVREILERIDQSLEKLRQATNPFAELTEPVARATQATSRLNETITRTTAATEAASEGVTALGSALNEIGEEATQAATGLGRMGTEAEVASNRVSSAMERAQAAYRAAASMANVPPAPEGSGPSGPGYFSRVGSAGKGFHDAIQTGFGSAFGAAAAGFGVLAPVHSAAEYDNLLTHIGITEQIPVEQNAAFAQALGRRIDRIAQQTGQRSADLVESASFLSMEGYSMDQINAFVPQIARISTAYNAHPDAVAKTAFALSQNFHLTEAQMPAGLAMVARVGKEAALPLEQLAPLFPEVAATAAQLGVSGPQGVADVASMLAVIRKNVGSEGKATTDMRQVMSTLTSNHGRRRFRELLGWDPRDVMHAAQDKGADPLSAVVDKIAAIPNARKRQDAISDLFVGMEDQTGASAMIRDFGQMMDIRKRIQNTSPEMIQKDFLVGLTSTLIRLNAFEDGLAQIERRVGNAFVPVLNVGTVALHGITNAFDAVNKATGGVAKIAVTGAGAILGLTAALGAVGAVLIPIKAGLGLVNAMTGGWLLRIGLLGSRILKLPFSFMVRGAGLLVGALGPVGLAVAGVTAALGVAYLAWRNWDRIKPMLTGLGNWISGWAKQIGGYLAAMLHPLDQWFDHTSMGQAMDKWLAHPDVPAAVPAAPAAQSGDGSGGKFGLHVSHDPGLQVRQTSGQRGLVSISPDRGRMVAVP